MGILKQEIGQFLTPAKAALLIVGFLIIGCTSTPVENQSPAIDCMGEVSSKIRQAPKKEYLHTLDGQEVPLKEFFNQCQERAPDCILFEKFYYWENEVKQVVSKTDSGPIKHRIRAYYNPLSICRPQKIRPGRTHGDVAEFYDAKGRFMGLAVYMGQGRYFLLHYSGYRKSKTAPKVIPQPSCMRMSFYPIRIEKEKSTRMHYGKPRKCCFRSCPSSNIQSFEAFLHLFEIPC